MVITKSEIKTVNQGQLFSIELLEEYQYSLETSNRSSKTITWYMYILRGYLNFLKLQELLKPIYELGREELRQYIKHLQIVDRWANRPYIKAKNRGKLSPYSIQGHVRAVKAFWGWLLEEEHIENNPLVKFPLPKVPQLLPKILSLEEVKRLRAEIDRATSPGARYYCIFLLLLDTGIRVSELTHLRLEDLDLGHHLLGIMGKGKVERCVPVSKWTRKAVVRYINNHRPALCETDSPYLFPSSDGEPMPINSIQQFFGRLATKADMAGVKVSPHVFRHTFATRSLSNGANVLVLRDIMGHKSLQTTMKYVHLQPQDIQKQHSAFSPIRDLFVKQ